MCVGGRLLMEESGWAACFEFVWIFRCYLSSSAAVSHCDVFSSNAVKTGLVFFGKFSGNRICKDVLSFFHVRSFISGIFFFILHFVW